jgi:hypothetical protein
VPRLMSFPFRLNQAGAIATVDQGSDTEVEEHIALAMLTRPGERITVPTFGVADPAFSSFQLGALQRHCLDFGPNVDVTAVNVSFLSEERESVSISWRRHGETQVTGGAQ